MISVFHNYHSFVSFESHHIVTELTEYGSQNNERNKRWKLEKPKCVKKKKSTFPQCLFFILFSHFFWLFMNTVGVGFILYPPPPPQYKRINFQQKILFLNNCCYSNIFLCSLMLPPSNPSPGRVFAPVSIGRPSWCLQGEMMMGGEWRKKGKWRVWTRNRIKRGSPFVVTAVPAQEKIKIKDSRHSLLRPLEWLTILKKK